MGSKSLSLPDAELAIMRCLWERGQASARQLTEWLYKDGSPAHVATVQKLLSRLEEKQCVHRNREPWPHLFEASVEREDVIGDQLQQTAARLCDGEMHPLLTHLVKKAQLSREDRQSLRELLDNLDAQS